MSAGWYAAVVAAVAVGRAIATSALGKMSRRGRARSSRRPRSSRQQRTSKGLPPLIYLVDRFQINGGEGGPGGPDPIYMYLDQPLHWRYCSAELLLAVLSVYQWRARLRLSGRPALYSPDGPGALCWPISSNCRSVGGVRFVCSQHFVGWLHVVFPTSRHL